VRRSYGVKVTAILTAISVVVLLCGLIADREEMIAAGAAAAFLFLLLVPAFGLRAGRVEKIRARQGALLAWEYAPCEIGEIVRTQRRAIRKTSVSIALLMCVCLVVIFVPFVVLSMQEDSGLPPMLPVALPVVLLPWLAVPVVPAVVARKIRRYPCVTLVGPDYILVANRYLGINDRHDLTAVETRYEPSPDGGMATLRVRYRFKVGRVTTLIHRWVDVPVPHGREREAAELDL
jgi:hypothetical protein